MPQLNPEFFLSQIFWLILSFSFLFIFLWRVSLPRINKALENRQNKIDSDLKNAKQNQIKAEKIQKEIDNILLEAQNNSEKELKESINSHTIEIEKKLSFLDKEIDKSIDATHKRIKDFEDNAYKEMKKQIKELSSVAYKKLAGNEIEDKHIKSIVNKISINKKDLN